jgi:uncharacterized iron-regulated membrane protein
VREVIHRAVAGTDLHEPTNGNQEDSMSRLFTAGGVIASMVLIVLGIATIAVALTGRAEVRDTLDRERIVGSPDMTPEETRPAVEKAGLDDVEVPDCSVAEEQVDSGSEAKCFAEYLRIHMLETTGGQTYAEMPRFLDEDGEPTGDEQSAAVDPASGAPVTNPQRELWVTATALSTALNTSYFAEQVSLFSMVVGLAMLLSGIGFLVLTLGLSRPGNGRVRGPSSV